jgi:uncharacterized damage-inducible protein DinB
MTLGETFAKDLQTESVSGRAMLERIPAETFDWKPHEKSMTMKQLAGLVADMYGWFQFIVDAPELDFAKGYERAAPETTEDLIEWLDKKLEAGVKSLREALDERFDEQWKLRHGDRILIETTKGEMCRQTFGHLAHHRGQLSVYLRLKDIPVPPIYGPTADAPTW